jgi:hypothetical protein
VQVILVLENQNRAGKVIRGKKKKLGSHGVANEI